MAIRTFLSAAGDTFTVANNNVSVFGATGAQTVLLQSGVTGTTLDANIERVDLAGNMSTYKFVTVAGTGLQIQNAAGVVVSTIGSLNQAASLVFADGSATLAQTGSTAFAVAGTAVTVGATTAAAAVTPTTALNTAIVTGVTTTTTTTTTPTFTVAGAASATEGASATFTVTLSAAQAAATTVAYTLAGTGGAVLGTDTTTVANGTLTFAAGVVTQTVVVPFTFDSTVETGEGVSLTLSAPSTGTALGTAVAATTTIADPAAPTFALTSNAVAGVANDEGTTITYTITPSGVTDKAYTFTLSTAGDTVGGVAAAGSSADVSPASQTVTFAAGTSTAQTVVQTIVNDGVTEGLEGYKTSLLDSTFATVASKTGLITDPTSGTGSGTTYTLTASAPSITEPATGTKALTFTLTLGSAPAGEVMVNYATQTSGSATSDTDFVAATGTVTFIAGQTVANVSVVVNSDATAEGDETVAVLFSGVSLVASVTGTGTILANDTVGLTVVLTAGTDTPVLGADDDTINTNAPTQLTSADTVAGGAGYDILSITPTTNTALILDDAIFTNVSGVDKIVILTTGTGAQTITTGAEFNGAFGLAGADLQTTSTTGAMTINMSAVTGPATLTVITTESTGGGSGNSITMGAGVTTVLATSTTGPLTINAAAAVVATVTATTSTGFVNVTTGTGADSVTITTGDALGGNVVITGAGNDTINVAATTATTNGNTITGGLGADTITLTGNTSSDKIVIGNTDSGITVATADSITGFLSGTDKLKMGTVADATPASGNYVEAAAAVADFAAALSAANSALATLAGTSSATELYAFQWVAGTNGYLFNDIDGNGTADQVVVLVGIIGTTIAAGDVIA